MSKTSERRECAEQFIDEIVTVIKGPHKGRTGYCDDTSMEEPGKAIVYFQAWNDGYHLIPAAGFLQRADDVSRTRYQSEYQSSPERWYANG